MKYGYVRVSTREQNLDRQYTALREYNPDIECIFADKQSGKNFDRPEYMRMKGVLKAGDEVVIKELDRLGRNKEETKKELEWFRSQKVIVRILDVPTTLIDFQGQDWLFDMINNILIEVLASVAEEERKKIRMRQREGIDSMPVVDGKKVSVKTGRPVGSPCKDVSEFPYYASLVDKGEMSVTESCKRLGISRTQWYRLRG